MTEPEFLTLAEVLEIHKDLIEAHGGSDGIRDLALLESALAVPQAAFGGTFLHALPFEMAAAYAFHIAENQPFVDGNKRTALAAALVFLEINGVDLRDPKGRLYQAMMDVGARRLDKNGLAALLSALSHGKR